MSKQTDITKHPGGRPTKYEPESIFPKIERYIAMCGTQNHKLPTIEGLAITLGVSRETIYSWSEQYPEFSDTIKTILDLQKVQLMDDGMYGGKEVNSTMAIFLLKVNHGMKENDPSTLQQINVGTDKEGGNTITFVNFKHEPDGQ